MQLRQKLKLSIFGATALCMLAACSAGDGMMSEAPVTEEMASAEPPSAQAPVSEIDFCSAYPEIDSLFLICITSQGDIAHENTVPIDISVEATVAALEDEFGVPIYIEYAAAAGDAAAEESFGESDDDYEEYFNGDEDDIDEFGEPDSDAERITSATPPPRASAPPPPPPPPPPPAPVADEITKGRVAHHAPSQMVLGQPYLLEIAIQPLQPTTDIAAADVSLREAVGTGLTPGSDEPAPDLEFTTTRASDVMRASLKGDGFDITQTTETEQFLFEGEPTIWQWQVTPREPDANLVVYSLARVMKVNGEDRAQTVKTLPVSVSVKSLSDLLADDTSAPEANTPGPTARAASPLASDSTDSTPSIGAPAADGLVASAPQTPLARADSGSCTTQVGSDPARHVFVLNNQTYTPPISTLSETQTDGDRLSEALVSSGFTVTRCEDLDQRSTIKQLSQIGRTLQARKASGEEAVSFFYYSGHGANVSGENYILPSDLDGATPTDIRDGGVAFEDIFNRLTPVSTTSFVVFDACRTVMDDQSRGIIRSYTPVGWATGVLQAFATSPGQTAADSGVYSNVLSETMTTLDDPANVVFKRVQDQVAERTDRAQVPVYTDATTGGDFYFKSPT